MAEKKAERLQRQYGDRMRDALGQRGAAPEQEAVAAPDKYTGRSRGNSGKMLVANIIPDENQPRKEFDQAELELLASSLQKDGQLLPIRVRWSEAGSKWIITDGERRWRAAQIAGITTLECVFDETGAPAAVIFKQQLVANCLRIDISPIDQANAFQRLMNLERCNQTELAKLLNLNQGHVSRTLALLKLPAALQEQVAGRIIAPDVAREIGKIDDPVEREEVARQVQGQGLNRAEGVKAVKGKKGKTVKGGDSKVRTFKTKVYTAVLTFKKVPTEADVRAALVEILGSLPHSRAA
jgi:ParB family transcriptional regulator, chromosome partitioning protein